MPFLGKALYNLLFLNGGDDTNSSERWSSLDYRTFSTGELFDQLKRNQLHLDAKSFEYFSADCDSPEELFDLLTAGNDKAGVRDEIYLLLFELWKRLIPDKRSISVFCDELDQAIHLYDSDPTAYDEVMQEKLSALQSILDANVDSGEQSQKVFAVISDYLAHDLESFIYDYIYEQIEAERDTLASEILDGFYLYIKETLWFDYLRLRLFFHAPSEELAAFFSRFIESLIAKPDMELFFEVLHLLATKDCAVVFMSIFRFVAAHIKTYAHLSEMLCIAARFYAFSDDRQATQRFSQGIEALKDKKRDAKVSTKNAWYQQVLQV